MDIYWHGQAMFKIKGKSATAIIDPFDADFTGLKLPKDLACDLALKTHDHKDHNNLQALTGNPIKIDGPGEYEVKGVAVTGVGVFHDDKKGEERGKNVSYNINVDGVNIVHLGDIGHILDQEQIDEIGDCDILMVPVGGTFTITAKEAVEIISQLEPRIVIPMHYKIEGLKFDLDPVEDFLKEMGAENAEKLPKLTITHEKLPDETQVVLLSKG